MESINSDFDYIDKVLDGMESLIFQEDNYNRYNRGLVMGILESNGFKTQLVEGTEGFFQWFKDLIVTVYRSIKNFFKSIWDSIFNRHKSDKDLLKHINEATVVKGNFEENLKEKAAHWSKNSYWGVRLESDLEELKRRHKELNGLLARQKEVTKKFDDDMAEALRRKDPTSESEAYKKMMAELDRQRKAGEQLDRDLDEILKEGEQLKTESKQSFSSTSQWGASSKKKKARSSRIYDLSRKEWVVVNEDTDNLQKLSVIAADNASSAVQKACKDTLSLMKAFLSLRARLAAMCANIANKTDKQIDKECSEILALEHKK